jgi:hypothetical protein
MMKVKRIPPDELYHHGIKGQRWGIRRYQNPDGTLTEAGKRHYVRSDGSFNQKKYTRDRDRLGNKMARADRERASKNVKLLSDEELRNRIQRYQNETKLKELTKADLHPVRETVKKEAQNTGKMYKDTANSIISSSAKIVLTSALTSTAAMGLYLYANNKKFNDPINPNVANSPKYKDMVLKRFMQGAGYGKK